MKRLVAVLLLLVGCSMTSPATQGPRPWTDGASTAPSVGRRAPNFRLATTDGKTITLEELRGKPVLLNFFATWCTSCKQEMPLLERTTTSIQVLGIDLRDEGTAVAAFGRQYGVHYPLVLDTSGDVNASYGVANLPMTYVVDADGMVRTVVIGAVTMSKLSSIFSLLGLPSPS